MTKSAMQTAPTVQTAETNRKNKRQSYRNQPLKAIVNAPIGHGGSYIKILEYCEGKVTYLVPDEIRIAFMNGLLEKAAEMLSKM